MPTASRSHSRLAFSALLAAGALSACVVVPVDPRTGQPYPAASREGGSVTVVTPPPPPAAPQPTLLNVRLYPANAQANAGGMLVATVLDVHTGRGTFSVGYLGDTLQGEATRVGGARRGIANAWGPRGISVQCDYQISAPGQGTGSCLFSDGARYQMHF